jgi:hypothetical protein
VDIAEIARGAYDLFRNDAVAIATIRAEYSSLYLTILTNPEASAVLTSGTINGQTMTVKPEMTNGERLQLLKKVVKMFDVGGPLPRTTRILF